jgi:hypothetical protein
MRPIPLSLIKEDRNKFLNTKEKVLKAYGSEFGERILGKADSPLLTTTTGNLYQMVGARLWLNINTERNLPAIFRSEAWGTDGNGRDGWRVITGWPASKGYSLAETDNIPDGDLFSYTWLLDKPRTIDTPFSIAELSYREAVRGQAITWDQLVQDYGIAHKVYIAEQLAQQVGSQTDEEMTPLDQIVSSYDEYNNCATIAGYGDQAGKFYQDRVDRTSAAGWSDAYVDENGETLRTFTHYLVDDLIMNVREQCGIYDTSGYVFITGLDTQKRLGQLVRGHKKFTTESYQNVYGKGLREVSGQSFGFELNKYDNIPIVVSKQITDALRPSGGLTPMILVHLPDVSLWVDVPTTYTERGFRQGEDLLIGAHKELGLYHTMMNFHATKFFTHGKLRDIKTT